MNRTWEPLYLPLSADLLGQAMQEGALDPSDLEALLTRSPSDPLARDAGTRLLLYRLVVLGAPVQ